MKRFLLSGLFFVPAILILALPLILAQGSGYSVPPSVFRFIGPRYEITYEGVLFADGRDLAVSAEVRTALRALIHAHQLRDNGSLVWRDRVPEAAGKQ